MAMSVIVVAMPSLAISSSPTSSMVRFQAWRARFDKTYEDQATERHRFSVFEKNVALIDSENAKGTNTFTLGENQYTDLEDNELPTGGQRQSMYKGWGWPRLEAHSNLSTLVPMSWDWRAHGAVTPIKDQGSCECRPTLLLVPCFAPVLHSDDLTELRPILMLLRCRWILLGVLHDRGHRRGMADRDRYAAFAERAGARRLRRRLARVRGWLPEQGHRLGLLA